MITLENNSSYAYDSGMAVWFRIADNDFDLSDFRKTLPSGASGVLQAVQAKSTANPTDILRSIEGTNQELRSSISISHLEVRISFVDLRGSRDV